MKLLGPRPGLKEINVLCWALFVGFLVAPVSAYFIYLYWRGATFNDLPAIDFTYFYGIGRIINHYPASELYNYELQLKVFNGIRSLKGADWGPSPYPPLVAYFFSVLAHFTFAQAYFIWMGFSCTLYVAGTMAAARVAFPTERIKGSILLCFALAFAPFFYYTLASGQLAAVAVFATGMAVFEESRSRHLSSGLVLSLLAYKPTLMLLVLPMLVVTRRFRALAGFLAGTAVWILLATFLAGAQIWLSYLHFLGTFVHATGTSRAARVNPWSFIDIYSVSSMAPGGRTEIGKAMLAVAVLTIVLLIGSLFAQSAVRRRRAEKITWAVTLTWTMLINVYVPTYDTVLVVIAFVLTLGALRDVGLEKSTSWFVLLGLLIFGFSAITESIAGEYKVQPLSILLLILGSSQLFMLRRLFSLHAGSDAIDSPAE